MASKMTQDESNEQEWHNTENWRWGLFYHSEKDSRLWVPKRSLFARRRRGGTPNFAKEAARKHFMILLGVGALVVLVVIALDRM